MARLVQASLIALGLTVAQGCTGTLTGETGQEGDAEAPLVPDESLAEPEEFGRATLGRLSRAEYDRTVADLLGTKLRPGREFPADDLAEQFDTVGSALTLSPLYVMAYERAAQELATDLLTREDSASRQILFCPVADEGESCARKILAAFASLAFRRPMEADELELLMHPFLVAQKLGAESRAGLQASIAAVLLSPAFLFKLEVDPQQAAGSVRQLDAYEVATRLSYTLWSTMPDDRLRRLAQEGKLASKDEVADAATWMLEDPKAEGLLDAFMGSWLEYRQLENHEVDANVFPSFTPELALWMKEEARLFLSDFLNAQRPAREMLDAGFSYLNAPLAEHYDWSGSAAADESFVRSSSDGQPRAGLLTLGAVLTATSFSSRTSPVRRGQFVLSRLLCRDVPPPPPGIDGIEGEVVGETLRERLQAHRADPVCRSCHELMDPLGFGLENYDAIGRYRETDVGVRVDATGELPDGTAFEGAVELSRQLAQGDDFERCLSRKFMTYAVGRVFPRSDPWPAYMEQEHGKTQGSLKDLLVTVVSSELFRAQTVGE